MKILTIKYYNMPIPKLDITGRMWVRKSPVTWDCKCFICNHEIRCTTEVVEMKLIGTYTHLELPLIPCPQCDNIMGVMADEYLD